MQELLDALTAKAEELKLPDIDTEKFYAHAFALYQAGNIEEATDTFRVLCTRHPFDARNWFGLASSCQEGGDYSNALPAWAMSALLDPSNPYPHFHAAECCFSVGNIPDALHALCEAKERLGDVTHALSSPIELLEKSWKTL